MAVGDLGEGAMLAAATGAYICFEDEAGQSLRPPKARTWARREHTPVVTVSAKGLGRVSAAGAGLPQARGGSKSAPGISVCLPASTPSTHLLHWICARLARLIAGRIYLSAAGLQLTLDLMIVRLDEGVE